MIRGVSTVQLSSQERILRVAREAFAEHGFRGARLADIASRAGLSHPTLLYHFKSKEDLYSAVIAAAVADWAHDTEAAASAGLSGFAQVDAILDAGAEKARAVAERTLADVYERVAFGRP